MNYEFKKMIAASYRPLESPPDDPYEEVDLCHHDFDDLGEKCVENCGLPTWDEYDKEMQDRADDFAIDQYISSREDYDY
jgi:hypothetical protein